MKIVKTETKFEPVSVVLESQDEVNWLYALFGQVGGGGKVREFVDSVYYGLEDIGDDEPSVFEGIVQIKSN
jgi:hypothetical protein